MSSYRINLDIFAGPLDLLLYLVRKEEVDIYDIPIAKITDQYIQYIEMLKSLDINLAGDFLVMAATLMQIKSAMLLPSADPEEVEDEDSEDPRRELIRQLLEYKKFKDTANLLEAAAEEQKQRFSRPDNIISQLREDTEPELDMDQVSIWDLLEAFDTICKATGNMPDISHIQDDTPIDLYQIELLHRLQADGPLTFERIFESAENRLVMVGMFLAMLELIRDRLIWAEQDSSCSSIFVKALTDEPAEVAVQRAIMDVEAAMEMEDEEAAGQGEERQSNDAEESTEEESEPERGAPIAIEEIPARREPRRETAVGDNEGPIPIVEIRSEDGARDSTEGIADDAHGELRQDEQ